MIHTRKATAEDISLLTEMGTRTFTESHGHSGPEKDIRNYIHEKFNAAFIRRELEDPKNIFHIIYYNDRPAGYSKLIFNTPHPSVPVSPVAKLERIYLLKECYGLGLGQALLQLNTALSAQAGQKGIWLFTWTENHRALGFYKKEGFRVVGETAFQISENHSNPNYVMYLPLPDP